MEVTKNTFNEVLPQIKESIDNCTFMGIDCEFTGLKVATNNINAFDTPRQYYEKVKRSCREFLVIQFGLSLFRYDTERNIFKHHSYNFYIFRRPTNRFVRDQRFLCQTSSIDFLITQGFDFNKLFKDGISYLNLSEQEKSRENIEEVRKKRFELIKNNQQSNDRVTIPEDAQEFVDGIICQLENFIESDKKEIALPKCNTFLRRLIYQTNEERFFDKVSLETRQVDKDRTLFATRLKTKEELEEIEQKKHNELVMQLDEYVGFTKVVKMIAESEKLIVGHNFMLDFLHMIDKFLTPLPDEYEEFKDCAHSLFKKVLDTKYMSSLVPFKDLIASNVLKQLLDTVTVEPFVVPQFELEEGKLGYNLSELKEHEAGFDAFMTGVCFLSMWNYLGIKRKMNGEEIFKNFTLLKPFINKIFLMVLTDNQHINLNGNDISPLRDHVFYLTFPKEWKTNNIVQLFSPFGNVQVAWIDDCSAYVGLYKKDQAAVALSTLSQSDTYTIMTYKKRQAILTGSGSNTILPSPIVSKRRKSTELAQSTSKKRKTDSFGRSSRGAKRSIEPIEEGVEEAEEKPKKVFDEGDWE